MLCYVNAAACGPVHGHVNILCVSLLTVGLWFHSENVSVACGHVWCDHGCDRWDVMLIATMVAGAMAAMASCFTTVRLTTAEVVQHPHVCPVHITYSIFYTSAVTFFI